MAIVFCRAQPLQGLDFGGCAFQSVNIVRPDSQTANILQAGDLISLIHLTPWIQHSFEITLRLFVGELYADVQTGELVLVDDEVDHSFSRKRPSSIRTIRFLSILQQQCPSSRLRLSIPQHCQFLHFRGVGRCISGEICLVRQHPLDLKKGMNIVIYTFHGNYYLCTFTFTVLPLDLAFNICVLDSANVDPLLIVEEAS